MKQVVLSYEDFQFIMGYAISGWHSDCASGFFESGDLARLEAIQSEAEKDE